MMNCVAVIWFFFLSLFVYFGWALKWGISWFYLDCKGAWCVEPYDGTHSRHVTLCWLSFPQLSWVIPVNNKSCYFIAFYKPQCVILVSWVIHGNFVNSDLISACPVVWRTSVDVLLSTSLTAWWEDNSHVSWYPLAVASGVEHCSSREPRWPFYKLKLRL